MADPRPSPVSAPDKSNGYPGMLAPGPAAGGLRLKLVLPIKPPMNRLGNSQSADRGICQTFGVWKVLGGVVSCSGTASYMLFVDVAGVA